MTEQTRVPVGVRFKEAGKVYYFDAGQAALIVGSYVVVETSHGLEIGRVVVAPDQVLANEHNESLKPIVRVATPEDLEHHKSLRERAALDLREAKHAVARDDLDMQIVSGEYDLEGSQITFYFTSADRVDFRGLSRELSSQFDAKVQFLQVGERDRAKLIDGYDVCGQRLCCSSWQTQFPAVSIKMAKEQDLPLNPQKISGVCGRLYCCLTFEFDAYKELRGQMPKAGTMVSTPAGEAKVNSVNVMKKTVTLWMTEQKQVVEMPVAELQMQYGLTVRPVELMRQIEEPLKQEAPSVEAPVLGMPVADLGPSTQDAVAAAEAIVGESAETAAPPTSAEAVSGETGDAARRRRGRRGGRGRRRPGGGPGAGPEGSSSGGPPGPPAGP
jgi:cell fate regulator YaaT (PSP1 superfamily)